MNVARTIITDCLGVTSQRLTQLIQQGIMPKPKAHGQYELAATVQAYLKHVRAKTTSELVAERVRLTKAKADRAQLDLALRAGHLYEKEAMDKAMFERGRQVRDALLSIPDRVAGIIAAEMDQTKVHALLYKELHQALVDLTS